MHSDSNSDPEYLDDALAAFTDQLMRDAAPKDVEQSAHELAELQATTRRIKNVIDASQPDKQVVQRIQANLAKEWKRLNYSKSQPSAWQRLWHRVAGSQTYWLSSRRQRRAYALSLAGLVVAILITALVLEISGVPLSAAVPDDAPLAIIGVVVIVGLGMLSWWLLRRR
jgi:hypothetical protein